MNTVSSHPTYQPSAPQPQDPINNQTPHSPLAPYTANVPGGKASFQPLPTLTFIPRTNVFISAGLTPIPGVNLGVTKTVRFDPAITLSVTESGDLRASVRPNMQFELSGTGSIGIPNILGTGVGVNAGAGVIKRITVSAPEFSTTLKLNGEIKFNANFSPTLTTTQIANVNGGAQASVGDIGGGISQSFSHETAQTIRAGGPGLDYTVTPNKDPQVSFNNDKTVTVTNSYTFVSRSSATANVQAGPVQVNGGASIAPTFNIQHSVTFSTDTSKYTAPKHSISAGPGVRADAFGGVRVSLLPPGLPVSLNVGANFNPYFAGSAARVGYAS